MAGVVKRLRPRIVVPICVGSNPTTRPIKKVLAFAKTFFICVCEGENPLKCVSILWSSSGFFAECGGLFFGRNEVSEKKIRRHV